MSAKRRLARKREPNERSNARALARLRKEHATAHWRRMTPRWTGLRHEFHRAWHSGYLKARCPGRDCPAYTGLNVRVEISDFEIVSAPNPDDLLVSSIKAGIERMQEILVPHRWRRR